MKSYFSQLARHTGLEFVGTTAAIIPPASPPARARREGSDEVSPLHVAEVVFTSSSQLTAGTSERTNQGIVGRVTIAPVSGRVSEGTSDGASDSEAARRAEFREAGFEDESTTRATRIESSPGVSFQDSPISPAGSESKANVRPPPLEDEYSAAKPFRVIEDRSFSISEGLLPAAHEPGNKNPSEKVAAFEDAHGSAPYQDEGAPGQNQPPRLLESEGQGSTQAIESDQRRLADARETTDRHVIVRNYLKEVRDWVAAPTDMEETELKFPASEEPHERGRDVSGLERGTTTLTPGQSPEEPGLQDLSLSIGTISIVIEAPRKESPVQQALPATTQPVLERTTSESIDLSRYYLRSW